MTRGDQGNDSQAWQPQRRVGVYSFEPSVILVLANDLKMRSRSREALLPGRTLGAGPSRGAPGRRGRSTRAG